jgi:hypothetical protein
MAEHEARALGLSLEAHILALVERGVGRTTEANLG